jgi:hypothetical protein
MFWLKFVHLAIAFLLTTKLRKKINVVKSILLYFTKNTLGSKMMVLLIF